MHNEKKQSDFNFFRKENNRYFEKDQLSHGPAYLVSLSHFHLLNATEIISRQEILLQMKLARFFQSLSDKKTSQIVDIFDSIINVNKNYGRNMLCKIPATENDV